MFLRGLINAIDLVGSHERARRVVHRDVTGIGRKFFQTGAHRIVTMLAACDNRANFIESLSANHVLEFNMPIFLRDHDDGGDILRIFERPDGVRDDRFAGDLGQELVRAHAAAAARGHDDGR